MLNILTQYKTVRDRYFGGGAVPTIVSTFWNPLDAYGVTLSNANYTAVVNGHGSADGTRPHAGWDNLELDSGKWYWEVRVETCTATGVSPHLSFGLRTRLDGMATVVANPDLSGSYEDKELRFVSDGGGHVETTTIPDIAVWHSNQGSAPSPVHDFVEIAGNYFTVDTTGVSGFSSGDVLMFALDRDAGKFWIGKNGTWFNSGDPAAGTGNQFGNMDSSEAQYGGQEMKWRFFFATTGVAYASTPLKFHLATGSNLVPQTYAAPTGFTALIDPASVATDGCVWTYRDGNGDWMTTTPFLNICWGFGGTIAVGAAGQWSLSVGKMQLGRKYYWEMDTIDVSNSQFFGAALVSNSGTGATSTGTVCLWGRNGNLHDGAASITMDTTGVSGWVTTDVLMFAMDLTGATGKMWVGKNGTFFNSGDPAAGTNPQFSNIPLTGPWEGKGTVISGAADALYVYHEAFGYSFPTPSGFTTTIPLVEAYVP